MTETSANILVCWNMNSSFTCLHYHDIFLKHMRTDRYGMKHPRIASPKFALPFNTWFLLGIVVYEIQSTVI